MSFPCENSRRNDEVPMTTSTPSTPTDPVHRAKIRQVAVLFVFFATLATDDNSHQSQRRFVHRPCGIGCESGSWKAATNTNEARSSAHSIPDAISVPPPPDILPHNPSDFQRPKRNRAKRKAYLDFFKPILQIASQSARDSGEAAGEVSSMYSTPKSSRARCRFRPVRAGLMSATGTLEGE